MRIAILGCGFAGLASAYQLLKLQPHCEIVLFDPSGIGGGASGVSVGLSHPYSGAHAKLNRLGYEGMDATLQLLNDASSHIKLLSDESVYTQNGFLRLVMTAQQEIDYQTSLGKHPNDMIWLTAEETAKKIRGVVAKPSIFIKPAIEVNSLLYLRGLWLSCEKKGAIFQKQAINHLNELHDFDITIVATGAACKLFPELSSIPLFYTKGQVIELEWPNEMPALPFPINSHVYLVMKSDMKSCIVGATYEKKYINDQPDLETARGELLPKAIELIPELVHSKILACRSGVRVSTPDHMPIVKEFTKNKWLITGFGSKGLLYHALYAQKLAQSILAKLNEKNEF